MVSLPADPELRALVKDAVAEGLKAIRDLGLDQVWGHSSYPSMSELESGMPSFTTGYASFLSKGVPKDYGSVIGRPGSLSQAKIDQADLPAFQALLSYARGSQLLVDRVTCGHEMGDLFGGVDGVVDFTVGRIATSVIERLAHDPDGSEDEAFDAAYGPLEAGLFLDERPFEALVPLLCTTVDVDRFDLADDVFIERMTEASQLKRMSLSLHGPVQQVLLGAATHALVVRGGVSRPTPGGFGADDDFPRARIEESLQAIKIGSDLSIGYAQMVLRPLGWATSWTTTLPDLHSGSVERRYPPSLDRGGWRAEPSILTEEHLHVAKEVLVALADAPANIRQAARRVDRAQIRDDDDDAVVDYCIALESLLDDTSHTETTHKCALRAAAVLSETDDFNRTVIFKAVKRAYGLRSAIVHGHDEKQVAKLRTLSLGDSVFHTGAFARLIANRLTIALLRSPQWQQPAAIDQELLLGAAHPARHDD